MADFSFEAPVREDFGKGFARRARMSGQVPAVVYAGGSNPVHITLPTHEVTQAVRLQNALFEVKAGGKTYNALVKDIQRDFVTREIEHIDLLEVKAGQLVTVPVPLKVEGEPKPGSFATTSVKAVSISVDANNIPRYVVLDINGSEAGAHFALKDVQIPAGSTLAGNADRIITAVKERAQRQEKQIDTPGGGPEEASEDASESESE
ncbi:MAG: 50S ribosomal protein L25/general stress protein Ctc [Candidatus Ancillula sp.]|jgi:large subunit ribosomal protein L25|nr:50S ribosomal protein L25/general stress protein Ctc [Candidatus Ancillula sp.]